MNHKQRKAQLNQFKVNSLKKGMRLEATDVAISIMKSVPLLVLRDKYGFGAKRLKDFQNYIDEMIKDIADNRLDFIDIITVLKEETGIEIEVPKRKLL